MKSLMTDMKSEAEKIGPYFHELEYVDPESDISEPVYLLKGGANVDWGPEPPGAGPVARITEYGVYITERGIKLCANPSFNRMNSAIYRGQKEQVEEMLKIAMTDNVGPYNENLKIAVESAFKLSRGQYLRKQQQTQTNAQNSIALASSFRGNISTGK